MKRVLIITYYWPPAGGGGVQRWLKFVKYLPEFGWQPVVFTPENADYPFYDESLQSEVPDEAEIVRHPIFEPYRSFRKVTANKESGISGGFIRKEKKSDWKTNLVTWIRGNLIIPDARRFWISPASKAIIDYVKKHPVDAIVSTGPPHSMHLIARRVHKATGIPWMADFRDPWVNMDNADKFRMSAWAKRMHENLEKKVLVAATRVNTVSWFLSSGYEKISGREVGVITNGYDHTDFEHLSEVSSDEFVIGHYGTFGDDRNPRSLWKALQQWAKQYPTESSRLVIELVGPTDASVLEAVKEYGLERHLRFIPYLKHDEVLVHMKKAAVLLVILNQNNNEEGRVTGKIFEYLATGNAILGIGSVTSDCARVINDAHAGQMVPFHDQSGIASFIEKVMNEQKEKHRSNTTGVIAYSRKALTEKLVAQLNGMIKKP